MSDANALKKISSGSAARGGGQVVSLVCQFLTGILVVRIITPAEYGLLTLALTVTGILITITNFGMGLGLPRTIAKQNIISSAENDVGQTIVSAILFTLLLSSMFTLLLSAGAEKLPLAFNKDGLAYVLRILSLLITPLALITIFGGIFQGLEITKPSVIFSNICLNLTKLSLIVFVVLTGLKFNGVIAANLGTAWLTFLLFAIYTRKKLHCQFNFSFSLKNTTKLLQFSFPLLGVQLLSQVITWVTTLLLGYFQTSEMVGMYSAPLRLVILLSMPLQAVAFLYLPVVTRSIAGKADIDLSELYVTVTKWIMILTLPMALAMSLDSKFLVTTLFGQKYIEAAGVLSILAIAYSIHALLGPNGITLIACGNRRALLFATGIGGLTSTVVSLLLIPQWGATGAALAVCTGIILSNTYLSIVLYNSHKIHAINSNFLKPVFFILFAATALFLIVNSFWKESIFLHLLMYFTLGILSLLAPFITRSITETEAILVEEFKFNRKSSKMGIKLLKFFKR